MRWRSLRPIQPTLNDEFRPLVDTPTVAQTRPAPKARPLKALDPLIAAGLTPRLAAQQRMAMDQQARTDEMHRLMACGMSRAEAAEKAFRR